MVGFDYGIAETCPPGDIDTLDRLCEVLREDTVDHVRLRIPVESWLAPTGRQWYAQVIERLAEHGRVLPALEASPDDPERLMDVVQGICADAEPGCSGVELCACLQARSIWDPVDPLRGRLRLALDAAAKVVRRAGHELVLGLRRSACTEHALRALLELDALRSASGIVLDLDLEHRLAQGIDALVTRLRSLTNARCVWLVAGPGKNGPWSLADELRDYLDLGAGAVDRLYWRGREHSLVHRLRNRPPHQFSHTTSTRSETSTRRRDRVLVTGGAGFVGSNLVAKLAALDKSVVVLDNLQRAGVERNLEWLSDTFGDAITWVPGDVRDRASIREAIRDVSQIFHLAGQVAVTSSLDRPEDDFEINARGTLNLLEEARRLPHPPGIVFTSTNKVYGDLADIELDELDLRYEPRDRRLRAEGISERRNLDLHSPYGCSKGAGDQYVLDYARSYDLPAVVFRMSCIYGPRQFGTEDQGWVAHFLLRALSNEPITIYGDGKQVRDILFVDDLVDAFVLASRNVTRLAGRPFNIGGGPHNTISLLELCRTITEITTQSPRLQFAGWRRGDQRYYVSNTSSFQAAVGWRPRIETSAGLRRLTAWLEGLARRSRDEPSETTTLPVTTTR